MQNTQLQSERSQVPDNMTPQQPHQNLIGQTIHNSITMSTSDKPQHTVQLSIISLINFNIEKAYRSSMEIAKKTNSKFQGIFIWGLINPNRDVQYMFFNTNPDAINSIIENIKESLELTDKNILFSVVPTPELSEKPAPSIMTT
jgi:hypothetical protein